MTPLFRYFILVVMMMMVVDCTIMSDVESRAAFDKWTEIHSKHYISENERDMRYQIFSSNVDAMLASYSSISMDGTSPYLDMTNHEYRSTILLPDVHYSVLDAESSSSRYRTDVRKLLASFPASNITSFDWRTKGVVPAVRDQGSVGTCWAFSTVEVIASQRAIHRNVLEHLSVEMLVDCDDKDCGVFGGWCHLAYEYLITAGGIEAETTYPYCVGDGKCYPCMANKNTSFCGPPPNYCNRTCLSDPKNFVTSLASWTKIPMSDSDLETALVNLGPLSVLINAGTLQYHKGCGIWKPLSCNPDSLNHAVFLVGFGDDKTTFGKTEKYWLIQNSWGAKFGCDGYFKLYRDQTKDKGECGINTWATLPILKL